MEHLKLLLKNRSLDQPFVIGIASDSDYSCKQIFNQIQEIQPCTYQSFISLNQTNKPDETIFNIILTFIQTLNNQVAVIASQHTLYSPILEKLSFKIFIKNSEQQRFDNHFSSIPQTPETLLTYNSTTKPNYILFSIPQIEYADIVFLETDNKIQENHQITEAISVPATPFQEF